jgi:hypothetical protein
MSDPLQALVPPERIAVGPGPRPDKASHSHSTRPEHVQRWGWGKTGWECVMTRWILAPSSGTEVNVPYGVPLRRRTPNQISIGFTRDARRGQSTNRLRWLGSQRNFRRVQRFCSTPQTPLFPRSSVMPQRAATERWHDSLDARHRREPGRVPAVQRPGLRGRVFRSCTAPLGVRRHPPSSPAVKGTRRSKRPLSRTARLAPPYSSPPRGKQKAGWNR